MPAPKLFSRVTLLASSSLANKCTACNGSPQLWGSRNVRRVGTLTENRGREREPEERGLIAGVNRRWRLGRDQRQRGMRGTDNSQWKYSSSSSWALPLPLPSQGLWGRRGILSPGDPSPSHFTSAQGSTSWSLQTEKLCAPSREQLSCSLGFFLVLIYF